MDWITFIKWNTLIYLIYYGINLLFDLIFRVKKPYDVSQATIFDVSGLVENETVIVKPTDEEENSAIINSNVNFKGLNNLIETESNSNKPIIDNGYTETITFKRPVEGQGIPIKEFLKKAKAASSKIDY